jgi:hypothetical protein
MYMKYLQFFQINVKQLFPRGLYGENECGKYVVAAENHNNSYLGITKTRNSTKNRVGHFLY